MIVVGLLAAFLVSRLAVIAIERNSSALGLVDRPGDRSSHVEPRPRGGGLGIVAGLTAALVILAIAGTRLTGPESAVLAGALLVAAAGLWDDLVSLQPLMRLGVQTAAAALVVSVAGGFERLSLPGPFGVPVAGVIGLGLALIWMVGVTNFFNFMDGADGLAAGQACVTCAAIAWVLWPASSALVPLITVGATAAFLTRNWAPARIFLGDVGSNALGFLIAAWPFAAPGAVRHPLTLLIATSLGLFLLDPTVTLVRRWRRGRALTSSHREHVYQRLFDPTRSHARAVVWLLAAGVVLTMVAVLAFDRAWTAWWGPPLLAAVAFAAEWRVAATRRPRA